MFDFLNREGAKTRRLQFPSSRRKPGSRETVDWIPAFAGMTAFLVFLVFSSPARAGETYDRVMARGTVMCGYYFWPPYYSVDQATGETRGLTKDLAEAVLGLVDLDIKYVEITPGYNVNDLQNGKVDAICGDGPYALNSIRYIDFARPLFYIPAYVYVRAQEDRFREKLDLNVSDAVFVGMDGDWSLELKEKLFPDAGVVTVTNITDPAQMLMDVASGKADAVICDPLTVKRFLEGNPGTLKPLSAEPLATYPYGFSVSKEENGLRDMFDTATLMALNMGLVDRALAKYDPDGILFFKANPSFILPGQE